MKKLIFIFQLILLLCSTQNINYAQGPWDNDLRIAFSNDGTTFSNSSLLLDSTDVPSIALLDDGTLIAAFQWFEGNPQGKVATMTSSDNGLSWTTPVLSNFISQPSGLFKTVDPTIVNLGGGQMRMYFSIGENMITDSTLDVFSATSSDGVNFTFDSSTAAWNDTIEIIEPAVGLVNGTWHCIYGIGDPWLGATHSSSSTGMTFNYDTHINSDTAHSWIGNFMDDGGGNHRYYGSTPNEIWWASTSDGTNYGPYVATNIDGTNPAVTKLGDGSYVMIYIEKNAPPLSAAEYDLDFRIYPNPAKNEINIESKNVNISSLEIYDLQGRSMGSFDPNLVSLDISFLNNGMYYIKVENELGQYRVIKFIKD